MRRLTFYIIAAALAFSASCSKQEAETAPAQKEKEYATILYATFDEVATKTHLEDIDGRKNVPCWDLQDAIWVSNGTDVARAEVVDITGGTSAKLGLSTKLSGDTFYAVYPYRLSEGYTEESPESAEKYPYSVNPDGTINIDIPTVQDGTFANANISAAVCSAGETLKFRNVTSLFKITSKLSSITTIKCSHANIAGNVTFTYGETSSAVTTGNANAITVTPTGSAPYYIAVAPGITYSAGATFATYSTATVSDKYSKKGKNSTTLARSKIYNLGFAGPEGGLSGEFTINDNGDKVCFSKGNLYCKKTDGVWKWDFYDEQYKYNSLNGNGTSRNVYQTDDEIDLFCWGYNSATSINPIATTYYTTFTDWGKIFEPADVWYTIPFTEWQYIFTKRKGNMRWAIGRVCDTNGFLIFPDDWSTTYTGIKYENNSRGKFDNNKFNNVDTKPSWDELEMMGVVFLPCAGLRMTSTVSSLTSHGNYWSTGYPAWGTNQYIYAFTFNSTTDLVPPGSNTVSIGHGCSVRLAQRL